LARAIAMPSRVPHADQVRLEFGEGCGQMLKNIFPIGSPVHSDSCRSANVNPTRDQRIGDMRSIWNRASESVELSATTNVSPAAHGGQGPGRDPVASGWSP